MKFITVIYIFIWYMYVHMQHDELGIKKNLKKKKKKKKKVSTELPSLVSKFIIMNPSDLSLESHMNNMSTLKKTPKFKDVITLSVLLPVQVNLLLNSLTYELNVHYTPRNEVRGGILESPCLSVRPSVCPATFGFLAHNCIPFTPIIM